MHTLASCWAASFRESDQAGAVEVDEVAAVEIAVVVIETAAEVADIAEVDGIAEVDTAAGRAAGTTEWGTFAACRSIVVAAMAGVALVDVAVVALPYQVLD